MGVAGSSGLCARRDERRREQPAWDEVMRSEPDARDEIIASLIGALGARQEERRSEQPATGEAPPSTRDEVIASLVAAFQELQLTETERARVAEATGAACPAEAPRPAPRVEEDDGNFWYIVWLAPGSAQEVRGIHSGGLSAWYSISSRLQGGRYCPGRDHLRGWNVSVVPRRRYSSEAQARNAYLVEAARHSAPTPPPIYRWV